MNVKKFKAFCSTESYIQNYECMVIKNNICFDACLWQELKHLWDLGIETTGSCCGHHVNCDKHTYPYIQVRPKYVDKMLELGYTKHVNEFGATYFEPKTEIEVINE